MTAVDPGRPPGAAAEQDGVFALADAEGLDLGSVVKAPVCPALGLVDDRLTHCLLEDSAHRCFADRVARKIPLDHQTRFCFSALHERCPIWERSPLNQAPPRPAAARRELRSTAARTGRPAWVPRLWRARPPLARPRLPRVAVHVPRLPGLFSGRALAIVLVALLSVTVVAAVAGVAVSRRSPSRAAPPAAAVEQPALAVATEVAAPPAAAAPAPVRAPAPPRAADLADERVLRPGAELVKRLNVSLDGSESGDIVVASRVPSIGGCERYFLDVYAYDGGAGRFIDVFDGSTSSGSQPQLLPQPSQTQQGCLPRIAFLDAASFDGGNVPLAIAAIVQADGRVRLVALALPPQSGRAQIVFDLTAGAGASVTVLDNPKRVEVTESGFASPVSGIADAGLGSVGTFHQVFAGKGGTLVPVARSFVPACYSGTVAAKAEVNGERWLRLRCAAGSGGSNAVFVMAPGLDVQPAGASFASIEIGDELTVAVQGTVRQSGGDPSNVVALAAGLRLTGGAATRYATLRAATATPEVARLAGSGVGLPRPATVSAPSATSTPQTTVPQASGTIGAGSPRR